MGFRQNSWATIWSVEPVTDVRTKARISTSRKNRQTGEYETDFSGYVAFLGTAVAGKAARLKERDRIRLGDVDVSTYYDKAKNVTYYNFNVFSFETQEEAEGGGGGQNGQTRGTQNRSQSRTTDTAFYEPQPTVDEGEINDDDMLPF